MSRLVLALAILAAACSRTPVTNLSIGTGGTGGVYYPYGGALAELWSENLDGVKVVAEVTGASVENVRRAHKGETVIGLVMGDVAYMAYHGQGLFEGDPQRIVALAAMYPSCLHVVARKGTAGRFEGRTISIGAPGSGTAMMTGMVLDALGVEQESFDVRRLSFVESANALKDGSIDVGFWCVVPPTSSLLDLAATHDIKILPFTARERNTVTGKYPFYLVRDIPGGKYRGIDDPVPTLGVWNLVICRADLPEQRVYDLARVLFENNKHMKQVHQAAAFTTPQNTARHSTIPLHPGTKRYLKEQGIESR